MQHDEPKFFGLPLNRVVAFLGPHFAWIAGAVATWLMEKVDVFATFGLDRNTLATVIGQALVFGVVTLVTWLGQQKWLDGFQKWAYGVGEGIANTPAPTGTPPYAGGGQVTRQDNM